MSVWPAWEVREGGGATSWFDVRLAFADGAHVELLAVVSEGRVSIEDIRAQPALSLVDLAVLADRIERPLFENCGDTVLETEGTEGADGAEGTEGADGAEGTEGADGAEGAVTAGVAAYADEPRAVRRARPAWPRGAAGRRLVAQEYRAAQEEGVDPVLAVMCATGHSRRRSLRLISQARDAGYLTPRHARR
ncbi:DUF6214 family protein [Streptomyces sp. NY05-11A]|uniref:DUF6214 family protein n=1 Tax=Streptomyces soliscabiei TaxID=588897 RepID=UPI0029B7DD0F|nr:DUF6214 family protein [Streptomyces sp. NY05-11A]MDX2676604.1 DUF6214 family protein [Streptomyces sp. NY05-11A]